MIMQATKGQAELAAKLAARMWDSSVDELTVSFREQIGSKDQVVFLWMDGDKAVGFAHCSLRYDYVEGTDSSPVGYLEGVFVEQPYRKKGIANALVNACERWAKDVGCTEFASDSEIDNTDSLAFHLRIGFHEESRNIHFAKKI